MSKTLAWNIASLLAVYTPLAQVPLEPLGGWAGLILQGGCFALLVYVVAVMYPNESKAAREERASRDKMSAALVQKFTEEAGESRVAFLAEQNAMRAEFSRERGELVQMLLQTLLAMRTAVHDVRDTAKTAINKTAEVKAAEAKANGDK